MSDAASVRWPQLPATGFISGRAATEQDIGHGIAIFVAKVGDVAIGKPLAVTIPQYAYWTSGEGKKVPVVIVQAEEANGTRMFGFRDTAGAEYVATGPELELLGTSHPK